MIRTPPSLRRRKLIGGAHTEFSSFLARIFCSPGHKPGISAMGTVMDEIEAIVEIRQG